MYDSGIDGTATDIYDSRNANSLLTRTSEYSKLTEVNSGTQALLYISNIPNGCVIDFEHYITNIDYASRSVFGIYVSSNWKVNFSMGDIGYTISDIGEWHNLRVTFADGSATIKSLDDPTKTATKTFTGYPNRFLFTSSGWGIEHRIRNVKVYPI